MVGAHEKDIIEMHSDLSQTHFTGSRGIKIKGKTGKRLHENAKFVEKMFIFEK